MTEEQQHVILSAVVFPISLAVWVFAAIAAVIEAAALRLSNKGRCRMSNIRRVMVCVNCEHTFELNGVGRCPKCGSGAVYPMSRWVRPVVPEVGRQRVEVRNQMAGGKEIGREILSMR